MSANESLIERFYGAFAEKDGAAMAACYAPDVRFSDPVFPDLRGEEAGAMWRMLTGQARDLRIELLERAADDDRGSARWPGDCHRFAAELVDVVRGALPAARPTEAAG